MPSTITGTFLATDNTPRALTTIQFVPTSTPFIAGADIITTEIISEPTNGSGELSVTLFPGYYVVHVGTSDSFSILVPDADGTYDIKDILVSIGDTPIGSARIVLDATNILNSVGDTVSVDVNQEGDPNAATLKVAVIGDYGYDGPNEGAVASVVNNANPNFIITTGDNNYDLGEASTIDNNIGKYYAPYIYSYVGAYGSGAAENAFFPAIGNHDYGNQIGDTSKLQPYLDYFTLPGNERYYTYTKGDAQFFVVNSDKNEPDGYDELSTQAAWLQAALAASTKTWKIVYFHHAPYCSESGYSATWMQSWPLATWGASMVLSGHGHVYERLTVDGIPHFVVGTGGRSIRSFGTPLPQSQYRLSQYGALFLEYNAHSLKTKFVTKDGQTVDNQTYYAPASNKLYWNAIVKKRGGIIVGPNGLELDYGFSSKQPSRADRLDRFAVGDVVPAGGIPTSADVLANPRLRNSIVLVGDDPPKMYVYNWQKKEFVLYIDPTVTTPYNASPNPKLAPPGFSPSTGTVCDGIVFTHAVVGAAINYSINGEDFHRWDGNTVLFNTKGIRYVAAYAEANGYVDSDVVVAEFYSD